MTTKSITRLEMKASQFSPGLDLYPIWTFCRLVLELVRKILQIPRSRCHTLDHSFSDLVDYNTWFTLKFSFLRTSYKGIEKQQISDPSLSQYNGYSILHRQSISPKHEPLSLWKLLK
jgi:hypothetical protein